MVQRGPDRRPFIAVFVAVMLALTAPPHAPDRPPSGRRGEPPAASGEPAAPRWARSLPPARTTDAPPAPTFGEPPAAPPPPPARPEAAWWRDAWSARIADDLASASHRSTCDSARVLLLRMGLAPALAVRARPDSALADRLRWLALRETYLPAELRPLLWQRGRAEDYRDLLSRAAMIYNEPYEIIAPRIAAQD